MRGDAERRCWRSRASPHKVLADALPGAGNARRADSLASSAQIRTQHGRRHRRGDSQPLRPGARDAPVPRGSAVDEPGRVPDARAAAAVARRRRRRRQRRRGLRRQKRRAVVGRSHTKTRLRREDALVHQARAEGVRQRVPVGPRRPAGAGRAAAGRAAERRGADAHPAEPRPAARGPRQGRRRVHRVRRRLPSGHGGERFTGGGVSQLHARVGAAPGEGEAQGRALRPVRLPEAQGQLQGHRAAPANHAAQGRAAAQRRGGGRRRRRRRRQRRDRQRRRRERRPLQN